MTRMTFDIDRYIRSSRDLLPEGIKADLAHLIWLAQESPDEKKLYHRYYGHKSDIFDFADQIFKPLNIQVKLHPTYTTGFYPEIVFDDNGSLDIIWDISFWNLFHRYIGNLLLLLQEDLSAVHKQSIISSYKLDLLYFMSYALPGSRRRSLLLAQMYKLERDEIDILYFGCGEQAQSHTLLAQQIALLHERNHFLYHNQERASKFRDTIIKLAALIRDNFNSIVKSLKGKEREYFYDLLGIIANEENETLIEEVFCDVGAVIDMFHLYNNSGYQDLSFIFRSYLWLSMFRSNLHLIQDSWLDDADEFFVIRKQFTSFASELMIKLLYTLNFYKSHNFNFDCDIDVDYKLLRQAIRQLCDDEFVAEVRKSVEEMQPITKKELRQEQSRCFDTFYIR